MDTDIYKVTDDFRRLLLKQEREAAVEMTRAYGAVWARIKGEIDTLLAEWEQDGGVNAGPDWAYRTNRLRKLEEQIRAELNRYTEYAGGRIDEGRRAAGRLGVESVGAQLSVTAAFDRLPVEAVEQMTGMLWGNSPLKILLAELPGDGAKAAGDALLRGLALGKGVKEIARDMRAALGKNLTRALRIARTETLRAYREASRAGYARAGVKRWEWRSARNERTCAACWAMDGKVFDVGEPMPAHVNCRCVMLPVTDTWEELGFAGIEEAAQPAPALDVFANLRPDQQLMVLGPAKFGAWQAGALKLPDLVGWKEHPLWGKSVFEKSMRELPKAGGFSISGSASQLEVIRFFDERYGIYLDASPGKSPTTSEARRISSSLSRLPKRFTKDNARFTELEILDDNPNEPDAYAFHQGNRITLFRKALRKDAVHVFARNGSALDEIIAHEVGESIWKQTAPEFRSNWAEMIKKYEAVGGMAGESANEQFAIWFSRYWVGDDIPREIEILVK